MCVYLDLSGEICPGNQNAVSVIHSLSPSPCPSCMMQRIAFDLLLFSYMLTFDAVRFALSTEKSSPIRGLQCLSALPDAFLSPIFSQNLPSYLFMYQPCKSFSPCIIMRILSPHSVHQVANRSLVPWCGHLTRSSAPLSP